MCEKSRQKICGRRACSVVHASTQVHSSTCVTRSVTAQPYPRTIDDDSGICKQLPDATQERSVCGSPAFPLWPPSRLPGPIELARTARAGEPDGDGMAVNASSPSLATEQRERMEPHRLGDRERRGHALVLYPSSDRGSPLKTARLTASPSTGTAKTDRRPVKEKPGERPGSHLPNACTDARDPQAMEFSG